ncbi:MAG4270 family putative restriction endonuclease [Mycoplasmoides alvi]|uniref:MAG4270 family putative restriction endonuclease n=1 Tax=Mycoplasmoides alvi TaxID=78580 RepID=UPI00051BE8BD|nr:HNH endonuclease [Mycoplasmoides alvi]
MDLNVNDFQFKQVEVHLTSTSKKSTTKIVYKLLIDEENFIHDYKISFDELEICRDTTERHENSKKNSKALEYRKKILEFLKIDHRFNGKNKEYIQIDKTSLKNLNEYISDFNWGFDITFQNVIYIITGSNPPGEGRNKSFFVWKDKDKNEFKMGFLLKLLRLDAKFKQSLSYESVWKDDSLEKIPFEKWIENKLLSNNTIKYYLNLFTKDSKDWEKHFNEFTCNINNFSKIYKKTHDEIGKLRAKFKENVRKEYNKLKEEEFCINFFQPGRNLKWDFAHIKPVHRIKQEYFQSKSKDKKKLNEICDPKNFLPLPINIHKMFDNKEICWDRTGKLKIIKNDKNYSPSDDLKYFEQIKYSFLEKIKKYLEEIQKYFI